MLKVLPAPLAGRQPTLTRVLMTSSGVVLATYLCCGSASPPEGRGSDPADTHKVRNYTLYLVFKEPTCVPRPDCRKQSLQGNLPMLLTPLALVNPFFRLSRTAAPPSTRRARPPAVSCGGWKARNQLGQPCRRFRRGLRSTGLLTGGLLILQNHAPPVKFQAAGTVSACADPPCRAPDARGPGSPIAVRRHPLPRPAG